MPDKTLSRVVVPDVLIKSYRPVLANTTELAVAGWAVAVWVYAVAAFIGTVTASFKYGISSRFFNPYILIGVLVTVFAVSLVIRLRPVGSGGGTLLMSGLVLYGALGAVSTVVGVIGFFASLTTDTKFFSAMQNISGMILGLSVALWAVGELSNVRKASAADPGHKGLDSLVPSEVFALKETSSSWEIFALGWMAALWVWCIGALFSVGSEGDLHAIMGVLLTAGPVVVIALSAVVRTKGAQSNTLGRYCLDLALLLALASGPLMVVLGVIDILDSFNQHGFGGVVGSLLGSVAGIIMGVLILTWALNEISTYRDMPSTTTTATVTPTVAPVATAVVPPPPAGPAAPTIAPGEPLAPPPPPSV